MSPPLEVVGWSLGIQLEALRGSSSSRVCPFQAPSPQIPFLGLVLKLALSKPRATSLCRPFRNLGLQHGSWTIAEEQPAGTALRSSGPKYNSVDLQGVLDPASPGQYGKAISKVTQAGTLCLMCSDVLLCGCICVVFDFGCQAQPSCYHRLTAYVRH